MTDELIMLDSMAPFTTRHFGSCYFGERALKQDYRFLNFFYPNFKYFNFKMATSEVILKMFNINLKTNILQYGYKRCTNKNCLT